MARSSIDGNMYEMMGTAMRMWRQSSISRKAKGAQVPWPNNFTAKKYPSPELLKHVHKETCTRILKVALFLRARRVGEGIEHPSLGKWMSKWWYINATREQTTVEINGLELQVPTWMNLTNMSSKRASCRRIWTLRWHFL